MLVRGVSHAISVAEIFVLNLVFRLTERSETPIFSQITINIGNVNNELWETVYNCRHAKVSMCDPLLLWTELEDTW